ncbi:MAG: glycerol-3-phosphate acyltransferase [Vicinamibacterales bacterium]
MLAAVVGYLVGSLPLGFLIARGRGGIDLRMVGSGNVGAANVYRSAGRGLGVAVMLVDVAKGASGVLLARLFLPGEAAALAGLGAPWSATSSRGCVSSAARGSRSPAACSPSSRPWRPSPRRCFVGATWMTRACVSLGPCWRA